MQWCHLCVCLLLLPTVFWSCQSLSSSFLQRPEECSYECGNVGGQGRDSPTAPLKAEKLKHKFKSYQTPEKTHTSEPPGAMTSQWEAFQLDLPLRRCHMNVFLIQESSSMCSLQCLIKGWAHTTASEPGLKAHQPNPLETNLQYLFNKWVWRTQPIYEGFPTQIYSHLASWCCWDVLQYLSLDRQQDSKMHSHLLFETWSISVFIPNNLHRLKKLHNTEIPDGTSEIIDLLAWGSSKVTAEPQWSPIKWQLSEHTGRQNKGRGRDTEKQLINGKD